MCGVVGMAVAPSVDPVTTVLQALPLFILFEASIWLSVLLDRRAARMKAAPIQT
jgi:Sec-independent protein secretion pathway component TatC